MDRRQTLSVPKVKPQRSTHGGHGVTQWHCRKTRASALRASACGAAGQTAYLPGGWLTAQLAVTEGATAMGRWLQRGALAPQLAAWRAVVNYRPGSQPPIDSMFRFPKSNAEHCLGPDPRP